MSWVSRPRLSGRSQKASAARPRQHAAPSGRAVAATRTRPSLASRRNSASVAQPSAAQTSGACACCAAKRGDHAANPATADSPEARAPHACVDATPFQERERERKSLREKDLFDETHNTGLFDCSLDPEPQERGSRTAEARRRRERRHRAEHERRAVACAFDSQLRYVSSLRFGLWDSSNRLAQVARGFPAHSPSYTLEPRNFVYDALSKTNATGAGRRRRRARPWACARYVSRRRARATATGSLERERKRGAAALSHSRGLTTSPSSQRNRLPRRW